MLEFNFSDPESGPVLDSNLPNSIAEYVSQKDSVSITNGCKVKIIAHTRAETIAHKLAGEGGGHWTCPGDVSSNEYFGMKSLILCVCKPCWGFKAVHRWLKIEESYQEFYCWV